MTTIATGSTVIIDAGYTTRIAPVNVGGELNVAGEINLTNGAADGLGLATGAATADATRTDTAAGIGAGVVNDYADLRIRLGETDQLAPGEPRTVGTVNVGGELNTAGELSTFTEQTATPRTNKHGARRTTRPLNPKALLRSTFDRSSRFRDMTTSRNGHPSVG